MDKIVSLCRRRGFVFPSSEIYGGLGSTYDYGHYGVLLKNNIRSLWFDAMVQERDDIVALDSAIILNPRVWEASGHVAGFTDPLVDCRTCKLRFRADQLDDVAVRPQAEQAAGRAHRVRPHRGAPVQPHVRDARRRARGRGLARVPPPGDGAGHLHQLQERAPDRAAQAAVRHRAGGQVVPQRDHARATSSSACASSSRWRWSSSSRPTRPSSGSSYWVDARYSWYLDLGLRESHLRKREHDEDGALALLERDDRSRVPLSDRLVGARGHREPRRLRPDAAHGALRHEARVRRPGRRALHAARDRAGGLDRPDPARVPRRRATTRRSSRSASARCCACIRASRR